MKVIIKYEYALPILDKEKSTVVDGATNGFSWVKHWGEAAECWYNTQLNTELTAMS